MYVQFSNFWQNETTPYSDYLYVLQITMQNSSIFEVLDIWSPLNEVTVTSSDQKNTIPFTWSMFGVGSVQLSFFVPGLTIPNQRYSYGTGHPILNFDTESLICTGFTETCSLLVTCTAFSDTGYQDRLNNVQYTVPINFPPMVTSYTGSIQSNGDLLLKWTTEGASTVNIANVGTCSCFNNEGSKTASSPLLPLIGNYGITVSNSNLQKSSTYPFSNFDDTQTVN